MADLLSTSCTASDSNDFQKHKSYTLNEVWQAVLESDDKHALREKCPYLETFWSECGKIKNQNNSEYGHFLHSDEYPDLLDGSSHASEVSMAGSDLADPHACWNKDCRIYHFARKDALCEQIVKHYVFEDFWWIYVVSEDNINAGKSVFMEKLCQFLLSKISVFLLFLY